MKKPITKKTPSTRKPKQHWTEVEDAYKKYKKYIQSSDWDKVKDYIYSNIYQCKCYFCGRLPGDDGAIIALHHNSYQHLFDEINHPEDLIPMCESCHRHLHKLRSNWKRFKK